MDEGVRAADELGTDDVLMAVAFGTATTAGLARSDAAADDHLTSIRPRTSSRSWGRTTGPAAAVALADGLRSDGPAAAAAAPGSARSRGRRCRRGRRWRVPDLAAAQAGGARTPPSPRRADRSAPKDEFSDVSTEDLSFRASQALLDVDNAVQRSEQELSAARGHFGDEAVAPFAAALEQSKADMVRAFEIRQQLDDDVPETEPRQRAMNADIIRACRRPTSGSTRRSRRSTGCAAWRRTRPAFVDGLAQRLDAVQQRVPAEAQAGLTLRGR